jgi:ring-1,2-phenylacetyl-CoA epoxidase subunit PaaA
MMAATETDLLDRIARGDKIESPDQMTDEYRDNLVHLMTMQADSELAGGLNYVPWIERAPTVREKLVMAMIVKDEMRHANVMYSLLADLGIDVQRHIQESGLQERVDIFYYDIPAWPDLIMFNFLMDRGAGHQLYDAMHCSYGPWSRAIAKIEEEERMHVAHGEQWVKRLARDPQTREAAQAALDRWWPRTLAIFGRPGTRRNDAYRRLGLKLRDNEDVRRAFIEESVPLLEAAGLRVPPERTYDEALATLRTRGDLGPDETVKGAGV